MPILRAAQDARPVPDDLDARLLAPYRTVRSISAGADGPWPGVIVRGGDGETLVLVDGAALPPGWSGWAAERDGHVLGIVDVIRRADGHGVLQPRCPDRLVDVVRRRRGGHAPLSDGETVTLIVSLARGQAESTKVGGATGEWWLTDAGRPVFAGESATADAVVATREAAKEILAATANPQRWGWVADWPSEARELARVEERAFAVAPPQPLAAGEVAHGWQGDAGPVSFPTWDAPPDESERAPLLARLGRHIDADAADLFSRASTSVWRRLTRRGQSEAPRAPRRRVWALAIGCAVAVTAVGVLWPQGGPEVVPAASSSPVPSGSAPSVVTPTAAAPEPAVSAPQTESGPADLVAVADALLSARLDCEGEPECLLSMTVADAGPFEPGAMDAADRSTSLVDDYGGVAVVRVEAEGMAAQLVVIQRENDSWLLRDVYAAQEP